METQTTIDDGWDLITDDFFSGFVQPSAKACPLPRPQPVVQPRLQAPFRLNATQLTGTPAPSRSGPCLTVARISAATPKGVPAFAPVRRDLLHHVSRMETPYTRVHRDDYYPKSLVRVSQTGSTGDSAAPHDILGGTALCPSTLQALPCPPLKKDGIPKVPKPIVRTSTAMQLTRSKVTSENNFIVDRFAALLEVFGQSSDVYRALSASPYAADHRKRLLNNFAATTVLRYLQAVQKFVTVAQQLGLDIHDWSEAQLADVLTVMKLSKSCDTDKDVTSGNFTIKALRWWHKVAGVKNLHVCFSPLVDSFLKTKLSKDKREAPPLPLWILFHWERRILQSASTRYEIMMLGAFLLITWSGLRFADAQRMNVDSLVFNFQELRGMVWRSKTMAAGHPFGVKASGLCSLGTFTWLYKFLRTWDEVMHDLQISRTRCDFLIPTMSPDGSFSVFEPLDYAGTTKNFRDMLLTPWKSWQGPHPLDKLQMQYTLHSMKATLLSFGPQLGSLVSDSDRLLQGHHQDPKRSLNLYGRDSVWGSLRYQQTVITEVQKGWRPKTAQHRGGQFPMVEPTVTLERFKKTAPEYNFVWLPFAPQVDPQELLQEHPTSDDVSESESDTSSSSSDSGSSSGEKPPPSGTAISKEVIETDEAVYAKHRRVTHAMVISNDGNPSRPFHTDNYWKAACGAHMLHTETTFLDDWQDGMAFCQHAGCKKIWASINLT